MPTLAELFERGVIYRFTEKHPVLGILIAMGLTVFVKPFWYLRKALIPVWCALALWGFLAVWRALWPQWWPMSMVVAVVGLLVAIQGPRLSTWFSALVMRFVPESVDAGERGRLDSWSERIYVAVAGVYLTAWMTLYLLQGVNRWTMYIGLAGLVIFEALWLRHRRSTIGATSRFTRRWKQISAPGSRITPLIGSYIVQAVGDRKVVKLLVQLADSGAAEDLAKYTENIASFYHLRLGAVFIGEVEDDASKVWLTFLPSDPWAGKIAMPIPVPGTVSIAGLNKHLNMGVHANGQKLMLKLQHLFVCGATGSGKSVFLEVLMTWLIACTDCVVVAGDLANGATLRPWKKALAYPLATTVDEVADLLRHVLAVIDSREKMLGKNKEDNDEADDAIEPTPQTPWLVLIIDEWPDYSTVAKRADMELMERIAKRARKAGVWVILAAQNGSKDDVGSKEIQGQMRGTVGLSLSPHSSAVLWGEARHAGWSSTRLRNGQFLFHDDEHFTPDIAKCYFVTVQERRRQVEQAAALNKHLEPAAQEALTGRSAVWAGTDTRHNDPILHAAGVDPAKAASALGRFGFRK